METLDLSLSTNRDCQHCMDVEDMMLIIFCGMLMAMAEYDSRRVERYASALSILSMVRPNGHYMRCGLCVVLDYAEEALDDPAMKDLLAQRGKPFERLKDARRTVAAAHFKAMQGQSRFVPGARRFDLSGGFCPFPRTRSNPEQSAQG